MLIYVLDPYTFERVTVIENYHSCIWTERFIEAGEVKLVVPGTHELAKLLRPGTLLECDESTIPMLIETRESKTDTITASGKSLETFFNERSVGPVDTAVSTATPGEILGIVVDIMQNQFEGAYSIPGVRTGTFATDGDVVTEKILQLEPAYDILLRIAQKYVVGMDVRRVKNSEGDAYDLVFTTRKGVDRTNGNPDDLPTVRFSPRDDNFSDVSEVYSDVGDVAAVTVHLPKWFAKRDKIGLTFLGVGPATYPSSHDELDLPPFGLRAREISGDVIDLAYLKKRSGLSQEDWDNATDSTKQAILRNEMERLVEAEYKKAKQSSRSRKAVDGEVGSTVLRYRRDYHLGDLVEVEGTFTDGVPYARRTAMVSEYILASDESGKRAYPTLSAPVEAAPYSDPPPTTQAEKNEKREHKLQLRPESGWWDGGWNDWMGVFRAYVYEINGRRRVELAGCVSANDVSGGGADPSEPDSFLMRLPPELRPDHMVSAWVPLASYDGSSTSGAYTNGWVVRIYPNNWDAIGGSYTEGRIQILDNFANLPNSTRPQYGDTLSFDGVGWDLDSDYALDSDIKNPI